MVNPQGFTDFVATLEDDYQSLEIVAMPSASSLDITPIPPSFRLPDRSKF
jgi:hypothetical protein